MTLLAGCTLALLAFGACLCAAEVPATEESTTPKVAKVQMKTTAGDIFIELYPDKATETVKNFLNYVKSGQYNNTIFHRVIPNFMIQGGGFTANMDQKPTKAPIVNEATNGLKNKKGTIAMARTNEVNSATAQFFINLVDNDFLDHRNTTPSGFGYCVFGKVTKGMDVVEKIGKVKTGSNGPFRDVPLEAITITEVVVE